MDRLCNNGLTYPINSQSMLRRNKSCSQVCVNGISPATNQYIPIPRFGQTPCPEQVPFDWNIPFLPELASRYSIAPQSHFQDQSSALPSHTSRAIQSSAQAVPGMDSISHRNVAGGSVVAFNGPLTKQSDISRLRACVFKSTRSVGVKFWVPLTSFRETFVKKKRKEKLAN